MEESEAIWRTLPLFPVSFGFAVALIGYGFVAAPTPPGRILSWLSYALILIASLSFLPAFRWLWRMVRVRRYRYLPNDLEILNYASSLRTYHRNAVDPEADIDDRVVADLEAFLLNQWATSASNNQRHNQARARARGRTVFYLMICIALALLANALILVDSKIGTMRTVENVTRSPGANPSARTNAVPAGRAADAARTSVRR